MQQRRPTISLATKKGRRSAVRTEFFFCVGSSTNQPQKCPEENISQRESGYLRTNLVISEIIKLSQRESEGGEEM
ncbi:hypothetical protein [Crocosphaera sp.]|uniref:hypothetical protein n=1 Tax=Crocosphaera sp. TaxID=2729996 RepID=UPI00260D424E|nr:hypothetical protein [Crocosphaera sp.]MDJ0581131.1 hypothetical protein [Crocosphaera sp.]